MAANIVIWTAKLAISAIVWVYILSFEVSGKALYFHANEIIVQNQVVKETETQIGILWEKIYQTAKSSILEDSPVKQDDKA